MRTIKAVSLGVWLIASVLASCQGGVSPSGVIEQYLQAIIDGDTVQAINLSCAAWEAQAKAEASSFEAVEARLKDVSCVEEESGEQVSQVSCLGAIQATYGAEDQELPLEGRIYEVVFEGGEWRMCGYR